MFKLTNSWIFVLFLLSVSCKTVRKTEHAGNYVPKYSTSTTLTIIDSLNHFESLTIKATGTITTPDLQEDFSCRLQIIKDSAILISIRKFGFEGMRILMEPHQIQGLDRLNGKYFKKSWQYYSQYLPPEFGFDIVQAIFATGSFWNHVEDCKVTHQHDTAKLSVDQGDMHCYYLFSRTYKFPARSEINYRPHLLHIVNDITDHASFPNQINCLAQKENNTIADISLNIKEFQYNTTLSLIFEIPESYIRED